MHFYARKVIQKKYIYQLFKNIKKVSQESHEDIISKYDQIFPKLNGKTQDTIILARVLDFGNYIKKILPIITVINFLSRISSKWH